ncbi:hypothetical protein M9458_052142 [Cirrhinus mrigala]|uniref:Uncharacterized protein n=1 Tax=Cirrhinus mrigala TaxID=683832 RepID=A0ABD0MR25_CIRMR
MEMELQPLKVKELKQKFQLQQNMFTRMNSQSEGAVKTSFIIPEEAARACRLFTEEEFIKNCIEKLCDVVCPDKKQAFANISLSRNTTASRVDELGTDLQIQLKEKDNDLIAYSLAIDESADRTDTAQLSIFIRGVDAQLSVTEELSDISSRPQDEVGKIATQQMEILQLTQQVNLLQAQVSGYEVKLKKKDDQIKELEKRLDDAEQYYRLDDLIISGLKTRHRAYSNIAAGNNADDTTAETETLESQII